MLNYLSAELWRMTRRRTDLLGWGVYFVLVALMALLWGWGDLPQVLEAFHDFLAVGLFLCFPLAAAANGDSVRSGSLFNELSYGLPRARVYLGKLLSALLAGLVLFLATAVAFLAVAVPLAAGRTTDLGAFYAACLRLWEGVWVALPRYIGALGLAHLLCFTLRTGGLAAVLYYLYLTMGETILATISLYGLGPAGETVNALAVATRPYLLSSAFFTYSTEIAPPGVLSSAVTGLGWLALTSAVGLVLFRRREIR